MRLDQLLDEVIELLQANEGEHKFKSFGDLQKHKFQMQKYEENPEEREIRSLMYKGTKGNSEAAKLGHKHRKLRVKLYDQLTEPILNRLKHNAQLSIQDQTLLDSIIKRIERLR